MKPRKRAVRRGERADIRRLLNGIRKARIALLVASTLGLRPSGAPFIDGALKVLATCRRGMEERYGLVPKRVPKRKGRA